MNDKLKEVIIYTDGSCIGNPGPGGYGIIFLHGSHRKELSGGFRLTTNNRMEIMAAIIGLQTLKFKCSVILYSDSRYLVDSITKGWVQRWKANNWKRNKKERAINTDLWNKILDLCNQHEVEFRWVRGHSGNIENERCDQLAVEAANQDNLPPDTCYENKDEIINLPLLIYSDQNTD